MLESTRRQELLDWLVARSGGNEHVRILYDIASISELEAMFASVQADAGLTHLQSMWKEPFLEVVEDVGLSNE